ncbi:MAG: choice-of-anchor Q domain-containing protein [Desulfocapsaceae bacterium]|nr:choice-of-anchor Q domain-containing protein [Desulfocapsaceae bacterium]
MIHKFSHLEFLSVVVFVVCLIFLYFAPLALANTYTVNDTADHCWAVPGRVCLRDAIDLANNHLGNDTIILPAGTYILSAAIPATGEDNNAQGDLDIKDINYNLTIIGAGAGQTIVDGNGLDRVFDIFSSETVSMSGMTIRNGKAPTGDMGGGGIRTSNGSLILDKVIVSNNRIAAGTDANDYGGGVGNNGVCTIINSTIANNQAYKGGGVSNNGSSIGVFMSTISGNEDSVAAGGMLSISNTLVVNSTISGNSSTSGAGGIYGFGASTIISTTITNNSSASGTDGYCNNVSGTLEVKNSIIAQNGDNNCCRPASITSNGYNLEDTNTCGFTDASDVINSDPKLAALQNNGGPTFTHALLSGSPAIDAGTSVYMFPNDQRGKKRPCGAGYDIGAYEKCSDMLLFIPAIIGHNKSTQ